MIVQFDRMVYKTAVGATDFGNIARNMAHSLMIILSEHFHATDLVHRAKWILEVSKLLDMRLTFTSNSSSKPDVNKGSAIWKRPHRHSRSLQVIGTCKLA